MPWEVENEKEEREDDYLKRLYADGRYPVNPNGAFHDIAGICDPSGTIFGLMPDWTKKESMPKCGDGKLVFRVYG